MSASFAAEIKGKSAGKASGKVIFCLINGEVHWARVTLLPYFLLEVTVMRGVDIWSYCGHFITEKARKWQRQKSRP